MLGNDIIDLQLALASGRARRRGFPERIGQLAEFQQWPSAFSPELRTWLLWAIKESAYKCYIQAGGVPLFAPKKFTFTMEAVQKGSVKGITQTPKGMLQSRIRMQETFLLAESWSLSDPGTRIQRGVACLQEEQQPGQSRELKHLVCRHFSQAMGFDLEKLAVKKNKSKVPYLYSGAEKLPYFLSLSHHGAWGAFSYQKEKCFKPFL